MNKEPKIIEIVHEYRPNRSYAYEYPPYYKEVKEYSKDYDLIRHYHKNLDTGLMDEGYHEHKSFHWVLLSCGHKSYNYSCVLGPQMVECKECKAG